MSPLFPFPFPFPFFFFFSVFCFSGFSVLCYVFFSLQSSFFSSFYWWRKRRKNEEEHIEEDEEEDEEENVGRIRRRRRKARGRKKKKEKEKRTRSFSLQNCLVHFTVFLFFIHPRYHCYCYRYFLLLLTCAFVSIPPSPVFCLSSQYPSYCYHHHFFQVFLVAFCAVFRFIFLIFLLVPLSCLRGSKTEYPSYLSSVSFAFVGWRFRFVCLFVCIGGFSFLKGFRL